MEKLFDALCEIFDYGCPNLSERLKKEEEEYDDLLDFPKTEEDK